MNTNTPKGNDMSASSNDGNVAKTPPISIDFKIPLPYFISAAAAAAAALIGQYYQLNALSVAVMELKVEVKANNATTIEFAKEQARMQVRIERLERDRTK